MEMEKNTKLRSVLRGQFTKKVKAFETLLAESDEDSIAITATYKAIKETYESLLKLDESIAESLITGDSTDDAEFEDAEKYKNQWFVIDTKFDLHKKTSTSSTTTTAIVENRQRIKLPKLEIPKFGGELEQWLPFWAQFKKIHEDSNLTSEDKFVYLLQSISENTEARQLVDSYPITEGNYSKCVEHLKQRYAREDLQTQLYVRKLLSVIINKDTNRSLTALYDKINAQLRSLETLGVTKKNAAFILPMVESALPEENLKAWQRSRTHNNNIETELNNLLEFLRIEVNNEQRLKMANANTIFKEVDTQRVPSTAECLVSVENKAQDGCIWCNKTNHSSMECFKIYKMTIEERRQTIKDKKACTICLKKGHYYKQCKTSIKCLICGKRHSTVLCMSTKPEPKEQKSSVKSTTSTASTSNHTDSCTLLQTVVVEIEHKGRKMPVRALYDSGSQRTYIKDQIAKALHLPVEREEVLTHSLFGGTQTNSKTYQAYNFKINSLDNTYSAEITALGQNVICNNVPKFSSNSCLNTILKAHDIKLTDNNNYSNEIGLLIGADYSGLFLMNQIIHLQQTGLVAIRTKLGWTLQGKQVGANVNNITTTLFCTNLNNDLTGYWSLETLGIQDPAEIKAKEVEANEIMVSFEESIKRNDDNRYEVRLPFKSGYEELLPNYNIARKRLDSTTNKIVTGGKFQQYHNIFQEWQDLGIIEQVPDSDIEYDIGHYLPHRAVVKESSLTSKLRPVFDASARDKNNLSLNACLEKGINMIDLIPNLLIGFRTGAIGVSADIQRAFLQISIPPIDRNYLKFLWWEDESLQKVITYRHCRVVFGLTSSPFLLAATLMHHLKDYSSPSAEVLKRSWYVDNCITSLDTEEDTLNFIGESKQIMEAAKFNLRMWVTSPLKINEAGKDVISVLGLNWDTTTDKLYCNPGYLPNHADVQNITKRELLSITQKIWDPIGYTAPVMLIPKLILQQTWQKELQWDDPLPSQQLKNFKDWYQEITYLNECQIPRRLTADKIKESKLSLHLFCDASKNGYAAGVVLRAEKNDKVTVQLILAKARVTPPNNISIPRLELLAALIGSRLLAQIKENINFKECPTYCWTDSSVVLCWIKRQLILNNFVGNRIKEIRKHTEINDWRHISGAENWMDLASRGCTAKTLYETRWWEGPAWLHQAPEQWPCSEVVVDEREVLAETRKTICNLQVSSYNCLLDKLQNYFSKYSKIVRTVAWILRYIHNLRHVNNKKKGEITYSECEKAEKLIVRLVQERNKEFLEEKTGNLIKYLDKEGIIRIETKLLLSDLPEGVQTPYLLPAKDPIVKLLVRMRHMQLQHAGSSQLISDVRTKFWIVGIRRLVKSVIFSCTICMRYRSKPTLAPTAPLPPERVVCAAPYQTTGVDLAGPLLLRDGEKCWIVLYTCAVYRAVHLELTRSLSTEAFIMTLRRFIARRGRVSMMMSDQGTNFHGTKTLLNALDWDEIEKQSTVRRITWKMNAPSAAWWGGYWERLIRIMKDLLRRILGKSSVSYDELETILCECEAVMNGRPLTYINDDKNTCLEPLTPAHFLLPASQPTTEVNDLDQIDSNSLNNRLKFIQNIREQFKERFKAEYLTLLIQKGKEKQSNLKEGDIVLIETAEKRIKWPLGQITKLIPGKDGVERTAEVRTAIGIKVRPIQRLYNLEVSNNDILSPTPTQKLLSPDQLGQTSQSSSDPETLGPSSEKPAAKDKEDSTDFSTQQQLSRYGRQVKLPSKFNIYQKY